MVAVNVLKYCLKFIALALIIAYVVLNRQETELYLSPLSEPVTLPLWLLGLVLFAFGFLTGALLLWLNSWGTRKELIQTKRKLDECEKDREEIGSDLHDKQMAALEKKDF